jgi:hypothetical protein
MAIIDRIRRIQPYGGTLMSPPLEDALRQMVAASGRVKHVILLTDGETADQNFYNYKGLIAAYARAGVSLSTIALGNSAAREFLRAIAVGTGGEFYYIKDTTTLPLILLHDKDKVLKKAGFLEDTIQPKVGERNEMIKGLYEEQIPAVLGYMPTKAKKNAEVALYTDIRGIKDPLLAGWRYGLGKAVAYTSDAETRWGKEMVRWKMFSKFWTQILRWTMRERTAAHYHVTARNESGKTVIELSTLEAREEGAYRIVIEGEAGETVVPLGQVRPDLYRGETGSAVRGVTEVLVEKVQRGAGVDRAKTPLFIEDGTQRRLSGELAVTGNNESLLKRVAVVTGGAYNPEADSLSFGAESVTVEKSLIHWLIPFIFAFFLFDIAVRKWGR